MTFFGTSMRGKRNTGGCYLRSCVGAEYNPDDEPEEKIE
jgi:hypothetical protein